MGHFEKALADLTCAEALTEPLSDDRWWIVNNTVCMYISLGQYDKSIEYGEPHVDAATAAGLERAAGPTLSNMAEAYIAARSARRWPWPRLAAHALLSVQTRRNSR